MLFQYLDQNNEHQNTPFVTTSGKANVELNEVLENQGNNISLIAPALVAEQQNLKRACSNIEGALLKCSSAFQEASSILERSSKLYNKVGNESMANFFVAMNSTFETLSIANKNMSSFFHDNIQVYFQYYKYQLAAMEYLIKDFKSSKLESLKLESLLWKRKKAVYSEKTFANWGLDSIDPEEEQQLRSSKFYAFRKMLPKETGEVVKQRMYYGYFLNKLREEFFRIHS